MLVAAVIPAAGLGKRLGAGTPKAFVRIQGIPLFIHTLKNLKKSYAFSQMIVAVHADETLEAQKILKKYGVTGTQLVTGGATRAESVKNAVAAIDTKTSWVLVHDAARPFVDRTMVTDVLVKAFKADGAVTAIPVSSTVKRAKSASHPIGKTEDRSQLFLAQTPQVFKISLLKARYAALGKRIQKATDEAALFDGTKAKIMLSQGNARNIKITTPDDVELMKTYLRGFSCE
jgi:2-C-methyl-D-erythritol 4-phosphate cytidylyltransferase